MTYLRALSRVSLVTFVAALLAAACGDSAKDPALPGTGSNVTPGGNVNTATGANNPAPGSAGGNAGTGTNSESGPGAISLNTPGRDPSLPINLAESGAVACGGGGDFCIAPNPTCCIAGAMGMNTFSCAASPGDCPADTVSAAACANALSCGSGEVCCRSNDADGNGTTASCAASCAAPAVQLCTGDAECGADRVCNNNNQCGPAPCTATSCATGELCCRGQGGGPGAAPACVAVADGALCPAGRRQVCADATTCPADNSCAPLGGGGGGQALVCTPPACTPTSCATGQTCCVGGQVGGNPTCSTPDATTALCPGNSRTVCITDAECAAVPGTQCLLNPNGGGSLSCRVPPPPPAADAGADGG